MKQQAVGATAPSMKSELRSFVTGPNLAVLIVSIALAVWGVFDGMTDPDGERFWGQLSVVGPCLYAGWCMLEPAWRRAADAGSVIVRLGSSTLLAPALVALPVGLIQAVALAFPATRATIRQAAAGNNGFHYHWDEGILFHTFMVPFVGWLFGALVALGVMIILTMPILSLRSPTLAATGSHLEKLDSGQRDFTTAFVFCGLGATVLGITLWQFGDGGRIGEFPEDLRRFFNSSSGGHLYWPDGVWLLGVVLVAVGLAALAWGCVQVMRVRSGD